MLKLNRFAEGLVAAERSVALAPDSYKCHGICSTLLSELGRPDESLAALEEAHRLGAPDAAFYLVRATILYLHGEPCGALAEFNQALELAPEDEVAHCQRGFVKLALGDWQGGWADREWRMKDPAHPHHAYLKRAPQWQGESLAGKRLIVYSELDYGDTFQFVRYLRLIENSGAAITLAVPEAARRLLAANFPGIDVGSGLGTMFMI